MTTSKQTGAHLILDALLNSGIDTVFANPGTSEMHLTAALADYPQVNKTLCLFEGGATGAADGYARMTGKAAATLLHLGPGLANGLANIHNAKKAGSPMVNVIGDHTTFHKQYDAPLNSDIEGTAAPYSNWVRTVSSPENLGKDTSEALAAAASHGGQIASLIIPADVAWSDRTGDIPSSEPTRTRVAPAHLDLAIKALSGDHKTGLILGREALYGEGLILAGQIAAATGATLLFPHATGRVQRGAGLPATIRIPFPVDAAVEVLGPFEQLLLIGAAEPVAFFAYPGLPSRVVPESANLMDVIGPRQDVLDALRYMAAKLDTQGYEKDTTPVPATATGPLTPETLSRTIASCIRKDMIIAEEGVTTTRTLFPQSGGCPRHDYLTNVGGSIGAGLPLALGASIACPDRPVLCISGDGSASYTHQVLWSMARHKCNVTVVICANHSYEILKGEMYRVGAMTPDGPKNPLLELDNPRMDWVSLANGYGVDAVRCKTAEALHAEIQRGLDAPGPFLIEAAL